MGVSGSADASNVAKNCNLHLGINVNRDCLIKQSSGVQSAKYLKFRHCQNLSVLLL